MFPVVRRGTSPYEISLLQAKWMVWYIVGGIYSQVAFQVSYHGDEDKELVDTAEHPPSCAVFEQFAGEDQTKQAEHE